MTNNEGFFLNGLLVAPLLITRNRTTEFEHLPDEIKRSIEEHKDEFRTERDLINFVEEQKFKS